MLTINTAYVLSIFKLSCVGERVHVHISSDFKIKCFQVMKVWKGKICIQVFKSKIGKSSFLEVAEAICKQGISGKNYGFVLWFELFKYVIMSRF